MRPTILLSCVVATCLLAWSCATTQPVEKTETPGLSNLLEIHPGVFSGGAPESPAAFEALAAMGVRSVLAVDAAAPNLAELHALGIVSAHIPIEYSGVTQDQRLALAKALATLPRPIYIHCHHGKNRGPAAACVALIGTGEFDQAKAEQTLANAGTSPHYPGLFEAVRRTTPHPDPASIDADLPETAPTAPLAEAMAMIDRSFERLELVEANGWTVPESHPDLVPVAVAAQIEQALRALADSENTQSHEAEFFQLMLFAADRAALLESAILKSDHPATSIALSRLDTSCSRCHLRHRNVFSVPDPAAP